jgi:hypothetical protein
MQVLFFLAPFCWVFILRASLENICDLPDIDVLAAILEVGYYRLVLFLCFQILMQGGFSFLFIADVM